MRSEGLLHSHQKEPREESVTWLQGIACFASEKYGMILCSSCYFRGNYQIGGTCSDFRMVKISEDIMHLLEALMHYGDDWRKVAQYVGKSEKECVTHFIKIPFGEEFVADLESNGAPSPSKRMCLTPLADAGNPIMAQALEDANSQLEKEGMDVERAISGITEIQEKIVRFEALELQMEKEWQKLEQMKSMLFLDKLTLVIRKKLSKNWRGTEKNVICD
ncbi:hypothetical protein ACFX13_023484 [Malus domestica]